MRQSNMSYSSTVLYSLIKAKHPELHDAIFHCLKKRVLLTAIQTEENRDHTFSVFQQIEQQILELFHSVVEDYGFKLPTIIETDQGFIFPMLAMMSIFSTG